MSTQPEPQENRRNHDVTREHGLQPETAPGLQFASSLRGHRILHRIIALIALLVIAGLLLAGAVEFIQTTP